MPAIEIIYGGDGGSDIHVMLHVNRREGFTIAVSEAMSIAQIAQICSAFEAEGLLIEEWDKVPTDWLTIRTSLPEIQPEFAGGCDVATA